MRLGLGLCGAAAIAACYSPHAPAGVPCSQEAPNCPEQQTCSLVAGNYICVEGTVGDAGTGADDSALDDGDVDAVTLLIDAGPDAPVVSSPWTLVQSKGSTGSMTNIMSSGAGHLIVVAVETTAAGPVTSVTDTAGNTYVSTGARAKDTAGAFGVEVWYASNSLAGALKVTASAPTVYATVVWEVSGIRTTNPLHTATKLDDQPATTMPVGASITTTMSGELVVSAMINANQISGIHTGSVFTNDQTTYGNGWAHLTDPAAPAGTYQAAWDQNVSGEFCSSSAAFFVGP